MDTNNLIIVVVVVAAVVLVGAMLLMRRRSSARLRDRFGPEYDRTLEESKGRREAEAQLHEREKRVKAFELKPLTPGDRERFATTWRNVQAEFVDNPERAVTHADEVVGDVMTARGYPMSEFDQRSADLSVDHPVVVQNYRAAHDIALRHGRGEASTEDLRQAMIHYRALFDEMVADGADAVAVNAAGRTVG